MTVVRNEMERGENNPELMLIQRTQSIAFDWHNYGKETIGARSDVENVDIGRLQAFYRLYYQPDNAVLIIAGTFDPDKTLALVAKYFGPIPKPTRVLPRLYTEEPVQDGEREVTLRRVGNTKWLSALYHTVPAASPDSVAVEAAVGVMTLTPGGRLYKSLVETKKASAVDDFVYRGYDPGFAMFLVQVPEQDPIDAARDTMLKTIQGVPTQPVSALELERVRAKRLKQIDETINDPQRLGVALSEAIAVGDWRLFFIRRDRWRSVTPAEVDRVARAYFKSVQPDPRRVRARRQARPRSVATDGRRRGAWSRTTRAIRRPRPARCSMRRPRTSTRARSASVSPTARKSRCCRRRRAARRCASRCA